MMWWGSFSRRLEDKLAEPKPWLGGQGAWMMNRTIDTQQRHGMDTYGVSLYEI